jgi:DNA-binding NarL/FixJ family response regulator
MAVTEALTCLVADDHPAVLEAVSDILADSGIDVTARARDGAEALERIEATRPDVALLDVRMPGLGGIEVARRAATSAPGTAILLYTGLGDQALLTEALDAGARGFVLKEAPLPDLIAKADATRDLPSLTQREREVLRLLSDGLRNEEIGKRLFISPETVRTHVRKAMDKLDADTRTQAVATALRQSLIA